MKFSQWLDKYRILIGIILVIIIGIGIIFLFWGDKIIKKNNNQNVYSANLESKINELENKVSVLEQNNSSSSASQNFNTDEPKQETSNQSGKININTASVEELDKLPGVGATRAQYIIEYRESNGSFKSISEIQNIKGIGPATYEKMKEMITVE